MVAVSLKEALSGPLHPEILLLLCRLLLQVILERASLDMPLPSVAASSWAAAATALVLAVDFDLVIPLGGRPNHLS